MSEWHWMCAATQTLDVLETSNVLRAVKFFRLKINWIKFPVFIRIFNCW